MLWPRSLGRDLTATRVLDRLDPRHPQDRGPATAPGDAEEPLQEPLLGQDSVFAFRWQLALHGEPLSEDEMDQLADAASPLLKLRGSWTVVDPATARKARRRLVRTVARPGPRRRTHRHRPGRAGRRRCRATPGRRRGVAARGARAARRRRHVATPATPAGLRAELRTYQRHGLTWLAELTSLGLGACLADDMGLGKTVTLIALHLHRTERGATGPTLVVCPASLLGNWEAEIRRFAPGVPVRRFHAGRGARLEPTVAAGRARPGASC